jgi:hypothetical protein
MSLQKNKLVKLCYSFIFLVSINFIFESCWRPSFDDVNKNLNQENCKLIRIKYYDTLRTAIEIKNKNGIEDFIERMNNSNKTSPWKGTAWGNIEFLFPNKTYTISTIGTAFQNPSNGEFYALDNILLKHFWQHELK